MNLEIEEELFYNVKSVDNIDSLNKCLTTDNEVILCLNIRSLNANYNKLLVFINSP